MTLRRFLGTGVFLALLQCALLVESALAHPGWGIVVDPHGQIYFGDVNTNTIWRVTPSRETEAVARNKHSHCLYLDAQGSIFGEHVYYVPAEEKWVFSNWMIGSDGGLRESNGAFRDREGNAYFISKDRPTGEPAALMKRSPAGNVTVVAAASDPRMFKAVQALTWGPDDTVYMTDGLCVRRVTMDGQVSTIGGEALAGVKATDHPRLLGLTVGDANDIYVADYDSRCVRKIAANGEVSEILSEGVLWSPSGVAAVGNRLYVLEHNPESPAMFLSALSIGPYTRLVVVDLNGQRTVLATLWGKNTAVAALALVTIVVSPFAIRVVRRRTGRRRHLIPGD